MVDLQLVHSKSMPVVHVVLVVLEHEAVGQNSREMYFFNSKGTGVIESLF